MQLCLDREAVKSSSSISTVGTGHSHSQGQGGAPAGHPQLLPHWAKPAPPSKDEGVGRTEDVALVCTHTLTFTDTHTHTRVLRGELTTATVTVLTALTMATWESSLTCLQDPRKGQTEEKLLENGPEF